MRRFLKAFVYAGRGLKHAFCSQPNFRLEMVAGLCVVAAGFFFGIEPWEWTVCVLCIALVMAAELVNTGMEALTDLVSPEYHPLAGKAKDAAAGAVLLSAVFAAIAGLIIFVPYCTRWINA